MTVTRGKGYRIESCSFDLNISSLYGLIKTRRLHSECRLWLDRIVWKRLDAAHSVLYEWRQNKSTLHFSTNVCCDYKQIK